MKVLYFSALLFASLLLSGCATWKGVKQDSADAWEATKDTSSKVYKSTKEAIHKATE